MRPPRLNRLAFCVAVATASLVAPAQDAPSTRPAGQDVPVKQVALFSSGVGYFEHAGTVTGDGVSTLRFKTEQINDVLKSLLLEDLDGGKVGTVAYPSAAPLNRTLKSFQVDITDNPPLTTLLNQLRGAKVTVQTMEGPLTGTILGVEQQQRVVNDKQLVNEWTLNLRAGKSLQPISLSRVRSLEMDDDKLNHELDDALTALARSRDQDKKPVDIHFNGVGDRRVRIGYVVETPVWKTSYRLVLGEPKLSNKNQPAPATGPTTQPTGGALQGWAVVENQTDTDWDDIQLSLVSGRPISFIIDLYHSIYVPRPFVETELYASLQPQTYQNGITGEEIDRIQQRRQRFNETQVAAGQGGGQALGQGGGAGGGIQQSSTLFGNSQANNGRGQAQQIGAPIDPVASVVASATAQGLGELFEYSVGNVTIKRQQSAMIPIITDPISARRVSIYNRAVLADHPLNGARIRNTTQKHLLAGPVTVLEAGSYAGDARLDDTPPGQQRLLSYGIDLKVSVVWKQVGRASVLQLAKIDKGRLNLEYKDFNDQRYIVSNHADKTRYMVIEQPIDEGWTLTTPDKPDEITPTLRRFNRPVEKDKTLEFQTVTENVRGQWTDLLALDVKTLIELTKLEDIPAKIHDALLQVIDLKKAIDTTQTELAQQRLHMNDITAEQTRLRSNLVSVAQNTDYYSRLIKKLDEQETQIEKIQKDLITLQQKVDAQTADQQKKVGQLVVP